MARDGSCVIRVLRDSWAARANTRLVGPRVHMGAEREWIGSNLGCRALRIFLKSSLFIMWLKSFPLVLFIASDCFSPSVSKRVGEPFHSDGRFIRFVLQFCQLSSFFKTILFGAYGLRIYVAL